MSVTGCRSAGLLLHERAEMHTSKSELRRGVDKGGGVGEGQAHLTPHTPQAGKPFQAFVESPFRTLVLSEGQGYVAITRVGLGWREA